MSRLLSLEQFMSARDDMRLAYAEGRPYALYANEMGRTIVADATMRRYKFANLDRADDPTTIAIRKTIEEMREDGVPWWYMLEHVIMWRLAFNRRDLIKFKGAGKSPTWQDLLDEAGGRVKAWDIHDLEFRKRWDRVATRAHKDDRFVDALKRASSYLEATFTLNDDQSNPGSFVAAQWALDLRYLAAANELQRWQSMLDGDLYWNIGGDRNDFKNDGHDRPKTRGSGAQLFHRMLPDDRRRMSARTDVVVNPRRHLPQRVMNEAAKRVWSDTLSGLASIGRRDLADRTTVASLEHSLCEYDKYVRVSSATGGGRGLYNPSADRPHKHGWVYYAKNRDGSFHIGWTNPSRVPKDRCREAGREPMLAMPGNEDDEHIIQFDKRLDPYSLPYQGRERSNFTAAAAVVIDRIFRDHQARDANNP